MVSVNYFIQTLVIVLAKTNKNYLSSGHIFTDYMLNVIAFQAAS